jgi:K+-transporting ATPase KdpF subunit
VAGTPVLAKKCEPKGFPMENLIVGIISILLFAYLLMAMIRPEKF